MIALIATISLSGVGNIAQAVIAGAAVLGLGGVVLQVTATRHHVQEARVTKYAEKFNQPDFIKLTARHIEFWQSHTYAEWQALPREERAEWLIVANFIEEVATVYNGGLINRNLASVVLGSYVVNLWNHSLPLIQGGRQTRDDDWIYAEWGEMKRDVPRRELKVQEKIAKRRARRKFFRGH